MPATWLMACLLSTLSRVCPRVTDARTFLACMTGSTHRSANDFVGACSSILAAFSLLLCG